MNDELIGVIEDDGLSVNVTIVDTGEQGEIGKSAYQEWLDLGNVGSEEDFLSSLKGQDGYTPQKGIDYFDGSDANVTNTNVVNALGYIPLSEDSLPDNLETTTGAQSKADQAEQNAKNYTDQEISSIDIPDSTWESIQNKPSTFAPSEHKHSIGSVTGLQNELNSKETPTGAQAKADIAESNAKDYTDVGLADKVDKVIGKGLSTNDYTTVEKNKLSDIATGANNYTHPTSHPASMITESSTKRFVSDSEKSTWNSKSATDTITTINGKTGVISKDDIVALGIPAQDTNTTYTEITTAEIDAGTASTLRTITARRLKYLLDKIVALFPNKTSELTNDSGFLTSVTKSDVGLGNVDNIKQMPISNGVLENYREKLVTLSGTSTTINLSLGNVFTHTLSGNTTYTITNVVNNQAHSFTLIITQTATARTLIFPASIKWQDGEIPDLSTPLKEYELFFTTTNGGGSWRAGLGGVY